MMKLNRYMGNVCTVTSPYNIHGKLQAIISLFYQESMDGNIIIIIIIIIISL